MLQPSSAPALAAHGFGPSIKTSGGVVSFQPQNIGSRGYVCILVSPNVTRELTSVAELVCGFPHGGLQRSRAAFGGRVRSSAVACGLPRSRAVFRGLVDSCAVRCGRVRSSAVPCGRVRSSAGVCGPVRSSAVVCDLVRSCAISCGREQTLLILRHNVLSPGITGLTYNELS